MRDKSKIDTLMFMYPNMLIGGIETYMIRVIRAARDLGIRIIWLRAYPDVGPDESFEKDLLDGYVEIVEVSYRGFNFCKHNPIKFYSGEKVVALAFDPMTFARLECIKKQVHNAELHTFYWIPHFTGNSYFLENRFRGAIKAVVRKTMKAFFQAMEDNDNIIYLNLPHMQSVKNVYNINIADENEKILKASSRVFPEFNLELIKKKSERDEFNIITVGRADFPHKAYMMGLLDVFEKLKAKYKQLHLTIISYGKDENTIKNRIERMPDRIKKDIDFVGKVNPDDLGAYFQKAHMNIGVASTIQEGAINGVISVPVRQYSEICEGYGFLPEAANMILSREPGNDISNYIETALSMSKDEFVEMSKRAYETYAKRYKETNILEVLEFRNRNPYSTMSNKYLRFMKILDLIIKVKKIFIGIKRKLGVLYYGKQQ